MSQGIPQSFIDANSCGIAPEFDEAGKAHMRDKAARVPIEHQAYGQMSDEWVADRVRMLRHRDLDHEAICCAARDRIMRLSLRVAKLEAVIREIADGFVPDGAYVGRPLYEMAPEMCSPASRIMSAALAEYHAVQEGVELGYLCSRDGTPCDFQDYPYEYGADADGNRGEMRFERRCSKCGEYPHG